MLSDCSFASYYFTVAQKKLLRFAQIKTFRNVLEYPPMMKGQWHKFFNNTGAVIVELACGRGEYTVGLSRLHKEKNYIGVDIKGNRMYIGAKCALDDNLQNAAFLRSQIEIIDHYFNPCEVDEIWITFPDPQLRLSKAKKRLTHPRFLRLYHNILKPSGVIHLKTDSPDLFAFTLLVCQMYGCDVLESCDDVWAQPTVKPELQIKTHYESLDIAGSKKIHYIQFKLPALLPNLDESLKDKMNE